MPPPRLTGQHLSGKKMTFTFAIYICEKVTISDCHNSPIIYLKGYKIQILAAILTNISFNLICKLRFFFLSRFVYYLHNVCTTLPHILTPTRMWACHYSFAWAKCVDTDQPVWRTGWSGFTHFAHTLSGSYL